MVEEWCWFVCAGHWNSSHGYGHTGDVFSCGEHRKQLFNKVQMIERVRRSDCPLTSEVTYRSRFKPRLLRSPISFSQSIEGDNNCVDKCEYVVPQTNLHKLSFKWKELANSDIFAWKESKCFVNLPGKYNFFGNLTGKSEIFPRKNQNPFDPDPRPPACITAFAQCYGVSSLSLKAFCCVYSGLSITRNKRHMAIEKILVFPI